jgi:Zn-dependent peptidase ImmA (M78 family)
VSDDPIEHREANAFALALLLPADWIRQDVRAAGGYDPVDEKATNELARRYGVSPTLMAFRIGMLFGQSIGKSHP